MSATASPVRILILLLAALALAACGDRSSTTEATVDTTPELAIGPWHASITLPGGEARFGLELARDGDTVTATIVNGSERILVPAVDFDGERIALRFPAFNNRIDAVLTADGLDGSLTLVKRYGETQVMPFRAAPGAGPTTGASTTRDLSGRWAVTFTEADGSTYPAVGEFRQRGTRLLGTFLTQTGDYRYLGGIVDGDTMRLQTFDGAHAFLFTATVDEDGALAGKFWSGTKSIEDWTGARDATATLADAAELTFLREGFDRFTFAFPDLDGNTVSLDDAQFEGKVVLVTLAGSWCPNCHDEAAFMTELYARYAARGVEVVALMYEHLEDTDAARAQVQAFRDKFGIQYTPLLAGISDKTKAAETLPALDRVLAFPTTIFIARDGSVREIHTGFSGPGTGEHYERLKKRIYSLVDTLVDEPGASAEPVAAVSAVAAD